MSSTTIVNLPRLHMAGEDGVHQAHFEVGAHGLALFLSAESPLPLLDIDGTREELRHVVDELAAALRGPDAAPDPARRGPWEFSS